MTPRPLLTNVQCLRAAAAYMVVLYHARVLAPALGPAAFAFGNAGVDIFFFISGFIISHVAGRDEAGAPGAFLLKRAIRIVPLYWLLTLVAGVAGMLLPALAGAGGIPDGARIVRSLLFVPYHDDTGETHPVLFMGWTLNFEVFFYLLFAVLLGLLRRGRLWAMTAMLTLLVAAGLVLQPETAAGRTYTHPMLLEFGVGMWMHRAWQVMPARPLSPIAVWALVTAMLFAAALLAYGDHGWPAAVRELKWGGPALMIVAASLLLERGGVALRWRWLLRLGEASYAIYLLHPFVIKAMALALRVSHVNAPVVHLLAFALTLLVTGVAGLALHLLVEIPLVRALRRWTMPRSAGDLPRAWRRPSLRQITQKRDKLQSCHGEASQS